MGHVVSEDGIKTDPAKTDTVKKWPVPKTIKEVRSFLGFAGYYRKFIRNFSCIVRPLNDLLVCGTSKSGKTKKPVYRWEDSHQDSFERIREELATAPVLAYADYTKPFRVHTDASLCGLGAVLYQHQDGEDRVVAYASRSLKPSEKRYHSSKLEFLALKWAITDKFHDYLYGIPFEVYTDNNPLTYVQTTAKLDACGQRWVAALANYDFKIRYRSGKSNIECDCLSRKRNQADTEHEPIARVTKPESPIYIEQDVVKAVLNAQTASEGSFAFTEMDSAHETPPQILQTEDWVRGQDADATISRVRALLALGPQCKDIFYSEPKEVQKYLREFSKLSLCDGILYHQATLRGNTVQQIVLPDSARVSVFKALHDDLGHQGRDRTLSLLQERFFWFGMSGDVARWVRECDRCIRRKKLPTLSTELVNITSSAPMELVCMDFLSLEMSKGGFENVLVITDHFTRYAQAIPTRNQTAQTTAKALFDQFFVYYGFHEKIHSDRGTNFMSKVIRRLCRIAGVKQTRTTPYQPQGNGQCERFNRTLLKMLGTLPAERKTDWKAAIPSLVHAYNATVHESTSYSPYELMFGRPPRLAIDAVLGLKRQKISGSSPADYMNKLETNLREAYRTTNKAAIKSGRKAKRHYDRKVRDAKLLPGDRVLVKNLGLKGKNKIADIWSEHVFVIREQPDDSIPVFQIGRAHV